MKTKLFKVACFALFAIGLLAGGNIDELAKNHVKAMQADGSLTNVITMLSTNRMLCNVIGHAWGGHVHVTLEYVPNRIGCRKCNLCGEHQSQFSDWK